MKTTAEAVIFDFIRTHAPFSNMDLARGITLALKDEGYLLVHKDLLLPPGKHRTRKQLLENLK